VSLCRSAVVGERTEASAHVRYVVRGPTCETCARSISDQVVVLRVEGTEQVRATVRPRVIRDYCVSDVDERTAFVNASAPGGSIACHGAVREGKDGIVQVIVKNSSPATVECAVTTHCAVRQVKCAKVINATAARLNRVCTIAGESAIHHRSPRAEVVENAGAPAAGPVNSVARHSTVCHRHRAVVIDAAATTADAVAADGAAYQREYTVINHTATGVATHGTVNHGQRAFPRVHDSEAVDGRIPGYDRVRQCESAIVNQPCAETAVFLDELAVRDRYPGDIHRHILHGEDSNVWCPPNLTALHC